MCWPHLPCSARGPATRQPRRPLPPVPLSLVTHDPSAAYTAAAASDRVAPHSSAPRLVTASVAAEAAWCAVVARASDASSSARNAV